MEVAKLRVEKKKNSKLIFRNEVETMKQNMQKHDEVQSGVLLKDIEKLVKNQKSRKVKERSHKIQSHMKRIQYKEREIKRLAEVEDMLLTRLEHTIQGEFDQYSTDVNRFTAVKGELQNFKDVDNLDRYIDDILRRSNPKLRKKTQSPDLNHASKKSLHEAQKGAYVIPRDKNFIRKNIEALKRNQELLRERQEQLEAQKAAAPKPPKSPVRPKIGGGLLDALKNKMK